MPLPSILRKFLGYRTPLPTAEKEALPSSVEQGTTRDEEITIVDTNRRGHSSEELNPTATGVRAGKKNGSGMKKQRRRRRRRRRVQSIKDDDEDDNDTDDEEDDDDDGNKDDVVVTIDNTTD